MTQAMKQEMTENCVKEVVSLTQQGKKKSRKQHALKEIDEIRTGNKQAL